jgi:(1->4)-alpha-D-glucan 1-alpha-D-glucosylmutase
LHEAAGRAVKQRPDRAPEIALLRDLALGARGRSADKDEFCVRFQQTTGPAVAKGDEDTAAYRWFPLVGLAEVGCQPDDPGGTVGDWHAFAARRLATWPDAMSALSTHDTKRSEDVRARLAAITEVPGEWVMAVQGWRSQVGELGDGPLEWLLWQTLVGAWPVSPQRVDGYLRKAMREAKTVTSWTDPDPGYEATVLAFAGAVLRDPMLSARIAGFVAGLDPGARANSLGAKLVQLTMPGVPDVYQGCELTGLSLADPDNRRPVDYAYHRRLLAAQGTRPPGNLDAEKLLVTSAALRLRRAHPDWFTGGYQPLAAQGPAAGHVVAFIRGGHAVTVATRLPATLTRLGGWAGTVLPLPGRHWRDVLTGATLDGPCLRLETVAQRYPVALLVPENPGPSRDEPGGE